MKKLICILLLFVSTGAFSQDKPNIYNPKADARAELKAAVAKAAQTNKHVFVQVGGNWCVWCIAFHNLVEATPELKNFLNQNFEKVLINYSPENKNEALLASLGHPGRFGFPVFLVIDGKGKVLHIQNSAYLEEGKGHSVKKVMEFLKGWTVEAVNPPAKASR
ncbi:thioredoxin family protein [Pedobacter yulinensis]|uniref:Thioredoxin family protein n=1 Tax=Pedobacter yulinensis TaxID=2126353 RepID=A0A2T3HR85_9SPHI|nr:thioredoxin family protein [Pedobacter yulinensis]PST84980.1 thioredoxin family protein [Pedobacter yulinensis]